MHDRVKEQTGIHALDRDASRESIARALMMTCGQTLENTFSNNDSYKRRWGRDFYALLRVPSGLDWYGRDEAETHYRAKRIA